MKDLPDAGHASETPLRFTINPALCKPFSLKELYRSLIEYEKEDPLRAYRGPMLLVRKSLPKDRRKGNSLSCYSDVAYNQSFYGYSAHGHPQAQTLVRYLHLFAHSGLLTYFLLCTSPSLGTERPVFLKKDFDACPIVPLEELTVDSLTQVSELAVRLEAEDETVFEDIDTFFAGLYGLTKRDVQVIEDTLTVRNPYDELGFVGSRPPTGSEVKQFCSTLRTALGPFVRKLGRQLFVNVHDGDENSTFRFLTLSVNEGKTVSSDTLRQIIVNLANRTGASIIIQVDDAGLIVGVLNQYRYWTRSRARLLAADILRGYFTAFEEGK